MSCPGCDRILLVVWHIVVFVCFTSGVFNCTLCTSGFAESRLLMISGRRNMGQKVPYWAPLKTVLKCWVPQKRGRLLSSCFLKNVLEGKIEGVRREAVLDIFQQV